MISKQDLYEVMHKEFLTTLKVLAAYPEGQMDFSPHERSSTAQKLMRTFVFELYLMDYALGKPLEREKFKTYNPQSAKVIIEDFKKQIGEILKKLENASDEVLEKTVEFGMRKYKPLEMLDMLVHDQIHHRGQLTVYVRMAGGLVPSIYGPSADDPSTNL